MAVLALAGCSGSGGGTAARSSPGLRGDLYTGPAASGQPTPLGMKWDWSKLDAYGPYLRQLSGSATFYQLAWCDIEPKPGHRDWSSVDAVVAASRRLGYPLYLKLRIGSCWATGGRGGHARGKKRIKTASAMPTDLRAYAAFISATARRYAPQGVHTWAIENEVNAPSFWDGTPADYERLVGVAAGALRSADPRARVLDGGISSTGYGVAIADRLLTAGRPAAALSAYRAYYARRFDRRANDFPPAATVADLRTALKTDQARRNLGFLSATLDLAGRHVIDAVQVHFYESWDNVPALLAYLRSALPAGFPIQAWEVGQYWPNGPADSDTRTGEMVKAVTLFLAGGVRRVIWLPLAFSAGGRQPAELRFGLLDPSGAERPAGSAFAAIGVAARGATWREVPVRGGFGLAFSRPGHTVLVLWGNGRVQPMPGVRASVQRVTGSSVSLPATGLALGTLPVVVSVNGPTVDPTRMVS